jgi:hypothetical protein
MYIKKKMEQLRTRIAFGTALIRRGWLMLLCAMLPLAGAQAACTVMSSNPNLNVGNSIVSALPASNVAGFRRMGVRQVSVNGSCDRVFTALRLSIDGLEVLPTKHTGQAVTHWTDGAAIVFRVSSATVGGVPVQMKLFGSAVPNYSASVDLSQNSVIELDVARLPAEARKSFSLQLELTALVPEGYAPRSKVQLNRQFSVKVHSTE